MLIEKKDYKISIIRMIAFCLIVTCHIMQYLGMELAWWFNIGVPIFLCISGYLYGQKSIKNEMEFYIKQAKKILIPYFIVVLPVIFIQVIFYPKDISFVQIIRALLCNSILSGGEHLWFIPTILFCYFLTPFLEEYFNYFYERGNFKFLIGWVILVVLFALIFGGFLRYFNPPWITCYMIGYTLGFLKNIKSKLYKVICICISIISLFNVLQIYLDYIVKIDLDGILEKVYILFCTYNHVFLGISLFVILEVLFRYIDITNIKLIKKLCDISDCYSYEGYLVHQFMILGPMTLMDLTENLIFNIFLILVLICVCSYIVKKFHCYLLGSRGIYLYARGES